MNHPELDQNVELRHRWERIRNPGGEHTDNAISVYIRTHGNRRILNCAIPVNRARELTEFTLPDGVNIEDCIVASVTGNFPEALKGWTYTPKVSAEAQLPHMGTLPPQHSPLGRLPWFQSPSQAVWLGISARHLRYHHDFWHEMAPRVLRGVHTTLVTVTPQIGYALTPHIQLEHAPLFLGSLARGLCPAQLFPAKYIYPQANLGHLGDAPAPIFADLVPLTGGFNYPVWESQPDPWRVLTRYENGDRYYGYPFSRVQDPMLDFTLEDHETGRMLLPNGQEGRARHSKSHVIATLDPTLKRQLRMNRDEFEAETGLVRGTCTHDGLPFQLPTPMQTLVFAIMLTQWEMELDRPGDLHSYTLRTRHAAIRGFNYFQKVEPFYSNFMRLIVELAKDSDFKTYPLSSHLTYSWLGGNLCLSDQRSQSEEELGPALMRAYYHQQLDWQAGVVNLMNHVGFRTRSGQDRLNFKTGKEIERELCLDGLAFHQMNRLLRFDSYLFPAPTRPPSPWPNLHPGWTELDRHVTTTSLPRL